MSWPAPTGEPMGPERGSPGAPSYPPAGPAGPLQPPPGVPTGSTDRRSSNPTAWPAPGAPTDWPAPGTPTDRTGPVVSAGPTDRTRPGAERPTHGEIETLVPDVTASTRLAPLHDRTGQPVRPWTIWLSATLLFGGAAAVTVGLLLAMWQMASPWQRVSAEEWTKVDRFNEATWLTAQFPSEPASGMRVLFAILCCLIAVLVAGAASVAGYYAFAGYRWTRIGALVALGVSLLALLLTPIAAISIGLVALGAAPLWLPASNRFFARWHLIRHPRIAYSEPIDQVIYGPLPRYR